MTVQILQIPSPRTQLLKSALIFPSTNIITKSVDTYNHGYRNMGKKKKKKSVSLIPHR